MEILDFVDEDLQALRVHFEEGPLDEILDVVSEVSLVNEREGILES